MNHRHDRYSIFLVWFIVQVKAILAERGDTLSTLSDVDYCIIGKNSSDSEEFM